MKKLTEAAWLVAGIGMIGLILWAADGPLNLRSLRRMPDDGVMYTKVPPEQVMSINDVRELCTLVDKQQKREHYKCDAIEVWINDNPPTPIEPELFE